MSTKVPNIKLKIDPQDLQIQTFTVEKLLEPLIIQVFNEVEELRLRTLVKSIPMTLLKMAWKLCWDHLLPALIIHEVTSV